METYEQLISLEDAPVVTADENGQIIGINDCFAKTFSWTQDQLTGSLLTEIMPSQYRDSHSMGISRFLTTESRTLPEHELDLDVVCGDGRALKSRHTIVAAKIDGQWRFAGKIVPLSEGDQAAV